MLIRRETLEGIVSGEIDLAFRRWARPSVTIGTRQRTVVGVIEITALDEVALESITDADAARAGAASAAEIRKWLERREGTTYRIGLRYGGPDPRAALRETVIQSEDDFLQIADRLARYDASSRWGPWTTEVLLAIAAAPGTPAADLAARFGREKRLFKADVRKLKELGLTESLNPGYRLSPRGESFVARLDG
jgi:hypothetical protein